jgi:DNA repair exonuclease SbcCD ATPase subunit
MSNITDRTPQLIAAEINSIKQQARVLLLQSAIEIGKRLTEAKSMVQHGEWGAWLEQNVDYSQSTANNLMRIHEEYGNNQISLFDQSNSQALANLGYTHAVALLAVPSYERAQFVEEHKVEDLSTRELQQLIKERDELKTKLETASTVARDLQGQRDQAKEEAEKYRDLANSSDRVLRETQGTVKMLQNELEKERQRTKDEVARLVTLLEEARASGAPEEDVEQLKGELQEAREQLKTLTEEAAKPVTIETAIVERVPEDVERELHSLRTQAKQFKNGESNMKFRVHFDGLVASFRTVMIDLAGLEVTDPESHNAFRLATLELISKMQEKLSA